MEKTGYFKLIKIDDTNTQHKLIYVHPEFGDIVLDGVNMAMYRAKAGDLPKLIIVSKSPNNKIITESEKEK